MALEKRWKLLPVDNEATAALYKELKIHDAICTILTQRNIAQFQSSKRFFRPTLDDLHDPWRMKDMLKAVKRIMHAFENDQNILIYGDYDVDGTTAVASMFQFLKSIYNVSRLNYYIPHRYKEGYGISKLGIDYAKENNTDLIISLDCGIKSVELIQYAAELGMDFIVCDHHMPDDTLPPAVAILNPKQVDCEYPFKDLCGCGVGFKLMQALCDELNLPQEHALEYLDLVATAIAADIVSMSGENRILAYYGLKKANENPNRGIKALKQLSKLESAIQINNLVFMIAPRVNAAGRMDDAKKAVQLFIAPSDEEAMDFAVQLHADNTDRKEADKNITEEALENIFQNPDWLHRKSTVVYQPHWHKGVVGIVASRLIDHYYRPTIVLADSGDIVAGSARSVPGFNLYEAIHACREFLLGYGGHYAAAGMTLEKSNVNAFREKFESVVAETINPEALIPEITIDVEVKFKDLNFAFLNILNQMEPFGPDNARPIFITKGVYDTGYSKIVKNNHIKFSLQQDETTMSGIGFGLAEKFETLKQTAIDIVFTLDENEWNGHRSVQLKILDLKPTTEK